MSTVDNECKVCHRKESLQVLLYATGICYDCQMKQDFKEKTR